MGHEHKEAAMSALGYEHKKKAEGLQHQLLFSGVCLTLICV